MEDETSVNNSKVSHAQDKLRLIIKLRLIVDLLDNLSYTDLTIPLLLVSGLWIGH